MNSLSNTNFFRFFRFPSLFRLIWLQSNRKKNTLVRLHIFRLFYVLFICCCLLVIQPVFIFFFSFLENPIKFLTFTRDVFERLKKKYNFLNNFQFHYFFFGVIIFNRESIRSSLNTTLVETVTTTKKILCNSIFKVRHRIHNKMQTQKIDKTLM